MSNLKKQILPSAIAIAITIIGGNVLLTNNTYADDTITITFNEENMCSAVANDSRVSGKSSMQAHCSDTTPTITMSQSDIDEVTYLGLHGKNISDITGIEHFTSLTYLGLSNNQIFDLSPLSNLTNLTELDLDYNQISNLSPLSGLTSLTSLSSDNNQISNLSPLSGLTSLTELNLYSNQISNLSPLSGLTSLTRLNLGNNQISDFTPILNLNLRECDILGQTTTDITNNKEYTLPLLLQLLNGTLDTTSMPNWVKELADMISEHSDEIDYMLQNATMNEDGKSITIIDESQPATIKFFEEDYGEEFILALLTVTYEEKIPAPDTGRNTKENNGSILSLASCIVTATILMSFVVKRFCYKNVK